MERLDFEIPIVELEEQLVKAIQLGKDTDVDVRKTVIDIEKKLTGLRKEVYNNLSAWQKVQISRHPERPYALDYIESLTDGSFLELHGDRNIKDDKAMIGGWGEIDGKAVMIIGQQKGKNTKLRQYRNFGMANPEGYRKALRLMKMAEKFNRPVVTLIDTPGAYPGLEAEERGQGEAIARNLIEMCQLKVPIICIIIGEGASGGALGIGIGDKIYMLENTWYSVISPESCSSILWRSWDFKKDAAEALKLTALDMLSHNLIDSIIKEPLGGAHYNPEEIYKNVRKIILKEINNLSKMDPEKRINKRIDKFCSMGIFKE
ncbi:MAG: acetyl-CoA carboxylase carboxyl transferase subunit alpha [Flavobacteriales bacterium]|nr:acetyl-CoA carboxylase carboxyl transferase subunit alpha [Flavobacteriales bacterium]|tara:strand:- start:1594 stop:2547 length:954 start_codon:yes stop_codon:yes gene_type:complete